MKKVVTFGEIMMRLSPPGHATFSQANSLEMTFGGGEANVAISMGYWGFDALHVTRFPDNMIGKSAAQFLRHHMVDTSHILYGDQKIGSYFLEKGAIHRPSEIVYDRDRSSFTNIQSEMVDWDHVLEGADWFHWTGITPGVSNGAAACCQKAIQTAKRNGVMISADIHTRRSLWNYGKSPKEVLPSLINDSKIIIASASDIHKYLGPDIQEEANEFEGAAQLLMETFPGIDKVVDKDRDSVSASHNRITGKMWNGSELVVSPQYDVVPIIDRVGTGDAFAAGLIYGLLNDFPDEETLKIASSSCALKHSIQGDANLVSIDQVMNLANGDTSGRINR